MREDRAGHCFQKEMGFHKEQPKKSRISDSGRLRTLVPLEVNISCGINRQARSDIIYDIRARYDGISAIGAGTNNGAATTVSGDLIEWADFIFVMEEVHRNKISRKFKGQLKNKRVIVLAIPDNFDRMDPTLVRILEDKVSNYVQCRKTP